MSMRGPAEKVIPWDVVLRAGSLAVAVFLVVLAVVVFVAWRVGKR
jgi:hypothetical protein